MSEYNSKILQTFIMVKQLWVVLNVEWCRAIEFDFGLEWMNQKGMLGIGGGMCASECHFRQTEFVWNWFSSKLTNQDNW